MVLPTTLNDIFRMTSIGLMIEGQPSQEEWLDIGESFVNHTDSVHWIIGDWLNYGIDRFNLTYVQAAELMNKFGLPFSNQTLRNDKYVAARIPLSWRHHELTFQHHKELASLNADQQKYWLSYASETGITTKELRNTIKGNESSTWLKTSNVWEFKQYDKKFGITCPSRIPGQIIQNLLFYYSRPSSFVVDPLAVDGTTIDVCTKCSQTKRKFFVFDIKPLRQDVLEADATKPWPIHQPVDFVFINALRSNILRFSQEFEITLRKILGEAAYNLKPGGVLCVLIDPHFKEAIDIDWSFKVFRWIKYQINLRYERRITLPVPAQYVDSILKSNAKKNHDFFSRILEVLVFKKKDKNRCSRCGISLQEKFADSVKALCPACLQDSRVI